MTGSEIREIKRRFDEGLSNIKTIYGCYVNGAREIVSTMAIPVPDMNMEERAMYAALFKKTVSGPSGRHLLPIAFDPKTLEDNKPHGLLMSLRNKHLDSEEDRNALYERIIESFDSEGKSYAILLAADTYDILPKDMDEDWSEESEEQFEYFVCSICPVKDPKAALRYKREPKAFRGASTGSILSGPILGFMFPSYNDRTADIYEAAYYTKKTDDIHPELIEGLFDGADIPEVLESKKEVLGRVLKESLGAECTPEIITALHANCSDRIHDEEDPSSSVLPIKDIQAMLKDRGISAKKADAFAEAAEKELGDSVSARTLATDKTFKVTSTECSILLPPENAVHLRTKKIDGITYFLIPAGTDIVVNGLEAVTGRED